MRIFGKLGQQAITKLWPVALLVMIIATPWAVKKSWDEHRRGE